MTKYGPEYQRQRNEKYFTPAWVTQALLERETFYGQAIDPAAGAGHILDVLSAAGIPARGFDIDPDRADIAQLDFFGIGAFDGNTITNPPFGIGGRMAVNFIEHALGLAKSSGGKVAMLLPLAFDSAKGRRHIFADCPQFAGKYVLTKRIRWANLEQKAAGPMENHQWCIWDHRRNPVADPFTRYI